MNTPPPATRRPYSLRKRVIGGGIVVGAAALIYIISGLGPGLGPGKGPGEGPGPGGGDENGTQTSQPSGTVDESETDNDPVDTGEGEREPPLKVLVTGTEYRIAWGNEELLEDYEPATLEEIVEIARHLPIENDELRVLIQYDRTGEVGARDDLRQALSAAGLTEYLEVQDPFTP